jgi:hypothetical protein
MKDRAKIKQEKLEDRRIRKEDRIIRKQENKEEFAENKEKIGKYKAHLKSNKLPKIERVIIKKEIRDLRLSNFMIKHPVLFFTGYIIGAMFEAINEGAEIAAKETRKNYNSLSPAQKSAVLYTAFDSNPITAAALTNVLGKYNTKHNLTGLKDQTKDKGKGMDY